VQAAQGRARRGDEDVPAWARAALSSLTALHGVRRAGIGLVEGGGRRLRFTASDRDDDEGVEWCHVDAYDDVPLTAVVRSGEAVLGALTDLAQDYPDYVERQRGTDTVALAAVPMTAAGQIVGGFVLMFDTPQAFDAGQRDMLQRLGFILGRELRRAQRGDLRQTDRWSGRPTPAGAAVAVHDVPPDPRAVAGARHFLRSTFHEWGIDEDTTEVAALCLSELVTNAVVHAYDGCVVRILREPGTVTTAVRDNGTPPGSAVHEPDDPLRVHGRGLQLVEALVPRWGSELDAVGTTVWFVVEV
jgi:anti-sigma regulatory factor (Ser/Thr protein kinase)